MFDGLPDLLLLIQRNGVLLGHIGGEGVPSLQPEQGSVGRELTDFWPKPVARTIKQLVRQALSKRGTVDGGVNHFGGTYEARVSAQGPDRALCLIRQPSRPLEEDFGATGRFRPAIPSDKRRSFVRRCTDVIASASLSERPVAVCVLHIEGLTDLARVFDSEFTAKAIALLVERLGQNSGAPGTDEVSWFAGPLNESVLALVIESRDRDRIEALVVSQCDALREPVQIGISSVVITPYAGVAILGADASTPAALLDRARTAADQARSHSSRYPCFFSDTVKLHVLTRADLGRELRAAIEHRELRLHYAARHHLGSGDRVAAVGFMRWRQPMRGAVQPRDFLPLSESVGLATAVSRSAMLSLREDYPRLCAQHGSELRISFAPVRHHVLDAAFAADVEALVADGVIPAGRLELRIDERTLLACDYGALRAIADLGVELAMGDFGRDTVSLKLLARLPLRAVQLDRSLMQGFPNDASALKLGSAAIGIATSLGLTPIATAVDSAAQREALVAMGCTLGSGDVFGPLAV